MHAMSIRNSVFLLAALAAPMALAAPNSAAQAPVMLPGVVAFEAQALGTATSAQPVTLRNNAAAPLRVGVLTAIGDFQVAANECPATLPAGASCQFMVQSVPTETGLREGKIVVAHDDDNGSSEVDLLGVGIPNAEEVVFSSVNLQFLATNPSAPVTRTLSVKNNRTEPLVILLIEPNLDDFEVASNECGYRVAPGVKCNIEVRFSPTKAGARNGLLWLSTNAGASPHLIGLSGASTQNLAQESAASLQRD